jgi:hypothetical protein
MAELVRIMIKFVVFCSLFLVRCFLVPCYVVRCLLANRQKPIANRRAGASTPITPESQRSRNLRFESLTAKSAKFKRRVRQEGGCWLFDNTTTGYFHDRKVLSSLLAFGYNLKFQIKTFIQFAGIGSRPFAKSQKSKVYGNKRKMPQLGQIL